MPCENCYTLAENVRELEARIRYLESKLIDLIPPIHITNISNKYNKTEHEGQDSNRKW